MPAMAGAAEDRRDGARATLPMVPRIVHNGPQGYRHALIAPSTGCCSARRPGRYRGCVPFASGGGLAVSPIVAGALSPSALFAVTE